MSNYRDDRDAARARIESLEAELRDLTAAQKARDTELELHRRGAFLRSPRWTPVASALALAALVVGTLDLFARVNAETDPPTAVVATVEPPPSELPRPSLDLLPSTGFSDDLCFKVYHEMLDADAGAGESSGGTRDEFRPRGILKSCLRMVAPSLDVESSGGRGESP
jgi:hypothetical protein